jgi:PEP-CTERM motif
MNLMQSLVVSSLALASAAFAAPITPTYTTFGTLAGATFNGTTTSSGIPNNAVAITTLAGSSSTAPPALVLGLTAHQRYFAAPVTNDGAGNFIARAGVSLDTPSPADPYATWNFGFYVGGTDVTSYLFSLVYDFDPAAGTEQAAHGRTFAPGSTVSPPGQASGSWNLGMDFLDTTGSGITQPVYPSFNPNAAGEYTFALIAYTQTSPGQFSEVARSAINVTVVPEPASLALVGLALAGLGAARRSKR